MTWKMFDCANTKVDCNATNKTIEPNPDIAGIGIITSFLTTTCLAVLIAFTVIFLDRYESIVRLYRRSMSKKGSTNYKQNSLCPYWRSTAFWSRVLSKNLLAFSDTQLLTGLAIQFAGLMKHCTMQLYHWKIVTELAFLTTITHLLTVIALRNYFVKNRWINLPRIIFMLANLGLLGYTSFVSYSDRISALPLPTELACYYQGDRPNVTGAFGTKWTGLLIGAIGGHVTVILAMYCLQEPEKLSKKAWYYWLGASFRTWIVAPIYAIYGLYMAVDEFRHTQALGNTNLRPDKSETEWSFGQFLPVLLLALPLFAGWESFWEEKDEDRENRFGRGSRWTWQKGGNGRVEGLVVPREETGVGESSASVEERTVEGTGVQTPRPVVVAKTEETQRHSRVSG